LFKKINDQGRSGLKKRTTRFKNDKQSRSRENTVCGYVEHVPTMRLGGHIRWGVSVNTQLGCQVVLITANKCSMGYNRAERLQHTTSQGCHRECPCRANGPRQVVYGYIGYRVWIPDTRRTTSGATRLLLIIRQHTKTN